MRFKNYYDLQRMDWPFSKEGAIAEKISAKYRKGSECRLTVNNKNENINVNVFVESELIGFINHPYSEIIFGALDNEETLHTKIVEVNWDDAQRVIPASVRVSVSSYPRKPKGVKGIVKTGYKEKGNPIDPGGVRQGVPKEILPQKKHYILGITFKEQRKKKIPIETHAGVRGIYCIWNRTHETYIGQSKDIGRRIYQHCEALWTKQHVNQSLQQAWDKGHSNFRFDVVKELSNDKDLDHWERHYIETFKTFTNGFNSTPDGQPGEKPGFETSKEKPQACPDHDPFKQEYAEPKKYQMRPASNASYSADFETTVEKESEKTGDHPKCDTTVQEMFIDRFDGRYYKTLFKRSTEDGIVRITVLDEIWCYRVTSHYYAEKLVRWFAGGREYSGRGFDYTVYI